jgi:hypothetical protein
MGMCKRFFFVVVGSLLLNGGQLAAGDASRVQAASSPCRFETATQPASVALCETFDSPAGTGNRAGQLNGVLWGVSRTSQMENPSQGAMDAWLPTQVNACGATRTIVPDNYPLICNGQLVEGLDDGGNYTVQAMYPKQPFDIAGRTGTATFDVTADSEGPHAAWPEFVYTDQPVPSPHHEEASQSDFARNSFGFNLASNTGTCTTVDTMYVTRNYAWEALPFQQLGCVQKSSDPARLNHFEVRISQSHVEVWGTDPASTVMKELAAVDNANLTLTRGLIWIEDIHYNADKFNTQGRHTFVWDNVGFDGPSLPRDLAFDVRDSLTPTGDGTGSVNLGYAFSGDGTPLKLQVDGLYNVAQAAGAILTFNFFPYDVGGISYRINGHGWHTVAWPYADNTTYSWRTLGLPVPLSEVQAGTNTIEFGVMKSGSIANVDIILVAAGGVNDSAAQQPPSTPSPSPTSTPVPAATTPAPAAATSPSPSPQRSAKKSGKHGRHPWFWIGPLGIPWW